MSTSDRCSEAILIVAFALALGCSPHERPEDSAAAEPEAAPPSSDTADYEPPPARPERRPRPERHLTLEPIDESRPLLAGPAIGPAAYFASKTDVVRLDASGWTRVWYGTVTALIAGHDGHVYLRDELGLHRLGDDALWTYVADDDASLDDVTRLEIGPKSEVWMLSPSESEDHQAPIPSRIDPSGRITVWDDPEHTGLERFWGMTVDGDGRAWLLVSPELGILHKTRDRWWARVQGWELGDQPFAFVDALGDRDGGLLLLTDTELLRVSPSGAFARAQIVADKPRRLAVNDVGQVLVAAGCHLLRYEIGRFGQAPADLGQAEGDCDEAILRLDDRGRAWQILAGRTAIVSDESRGSTRIELDRLGPWDVTQFVVVGGGPPLPAAVDDTIVPKPLPLPDAAKDAR